MITSGVKTEVSEKLRVHSSTPRRSSERSAVLRVTVCLNSRWASLTNRFITLRIPDPANVLTTLHFNYSPFIFMPLIFHCQTFSFHRSSFSLHHPKLSPDPTSSQRRVISTFQSLTQKVSIDSSSLNVISFPNYQRPTLQSS
jgi:hypothetical protein